VAEKERSALEGKRIVITRRAPESEALSRQFSALGAVPVILPLVEFADPDDFTALDAASTTSIARRDVLPSVVSSIVRAWQLRQSPQRDVR